MVLAALRDNRQLPARFGARPSLPDGLPDENRDAGCTGNPISQAIAITPEVAAPWRPERRFNEHPSAPGVARRQLLLPVDDNYFCRRRASEKVPVAT
jgi:hypothetical protein